MTPLERTTLILWMHHSSTKFPNFVGTTFAFIFMHNFLSGYDKIVWKGRVGTMLRHQLPSWKNTDLEASVEDSEAWLWFLKPSLSFHTRSFYHLSLDYLSPFLFTYSFIPPPLLWVSTIPGAKNYQRTKGNGLCHHMANSILWAFLLWQWLQFIYLGIPHPPVK